jgi:Glu-tRNA(Gln) amidotransferase subunit E-like FAD-binding protein
VDGKLAREGVLRALTHMLQQTPEPAAGSRVLQAMAQLRMEPVSEEEVRAYMTTLLAQHQQVSFSTPATKHRAILGELMKKYAGRINGGRLASMLAEELGLQDARTPEERIQA